MKKNPDWYKQIKKKQEENIHVLAIKGLILKVQFKRLVCKSKLWDLQASFNTLMLHCWLLISRDRISLLLNEVYRVSASPTHTHTQAGWTTWINSVLNTYCTSKGILRIKKEPCQHESTGKKIDCEKQKISTSVCFWHWMLFFLMPLYRHEAWILQIQVLPSCTGNVFSGQSLCSGDLVMGPQ